MKRACARAGLDREEFGFGYGGDFADGAEDGGGDVAIEADEGDGFGAAGGFAASEGEGGDVYAELAQRGADLADDTGFVGFRDEARSARLRLLAGTEARPLQVLRRNLARRWSFRRDYEKPQGLRGGPELQRRRLMCG